MVEREGVGVGENESGREGGGEREVERGVGGGENERGR